MPAIQRVLETALYTDDLDRLVTFYRGVMGFEILDSGPRLVAMNAGGASVLLLFKRGGTLKVMDLGDGSLIPPHDGSGPVHLAFAISKEELADWERHLESLGIAIESRVHWARGGTSLYFRDPDGHSVEVATPGVWATY